MKSIKFLLLLVSATVFLNSCSEEVEIDVEKPSIDLSVVGAFPTSCDTLYFDEPFTVKALLKDNVELGSYNIDIHNNFDQHTHTTEIVECTYDEIKEAVNPYVFIEDYEIAEGSSEYLIEKSMTIPGGDGTNFFDEGDYHFKIKVVDKEGWSSFKGFNVKILKR